MPFFSIYMSKNLEDIRGQVRSFLDEPIAADWTDAELNQLINARYHLVYTAAIDAFENYADLKTTTTDVVAGQQEYETQLDFLKMRRVEIKYKSDNDNAQRALPTTLDQILRDLNASTTGVTNLANPVYYLRGNTIGFLPVPDLDVTNGIKSWYYATQPDLVNDYDEITLPYADRDWMTIAYGAASDALMYGQQEPGASGEMETRFRRGVTKMQESLEDRVSDNAKFTVDLVGHPLDFSEGGY